MRCYILTAIIIALSLSLFQSCSSEELESSNISETNSQDFSVINGKLKFDSPESLQKSIDNQKIEPKSKAEETYERLYKEGFRSHKPMVSNQNKALLRKLANERKQKIKSGRTDLLVEDNLIGDSFFAAVINEDREVIVGDKIYKYTPKGLFFSKIEDSSKMRNVANRKNDYSKQSKRMEICELRISEGGISEVEPGVNQYITRLEPEFDSCGGGSGGGSGGSGSSGSGSGSSSNNNDPRYSDIALNNLIQGLDTCNGGEENWFQNIFGQYNYCHKYFSDDEFRFELDYWNQEWLIYASVGVEAETHEEGWFWWNNIDSDEIILGINNVHLVYELPVPNIQYEHNFVQNTLNGFQSTPLFMHDGRFMIETNNSIYEPVSVRVLNNTKLPFFDIKGENVLNIYLGKYFGYDVGLENYDIFNESNIRQIYQMGIDFLRSQASTNKNFVATIQRNDNTIDVLYFDEKKREYNTDEVRKVFDEDWSVVVGANSSDNGENWSIDYQATLNSLDYLGDYKYMSLDIYGLARRGNEWRGLRLILE